MKNSSVVDLNYFETSANNERNLHRVNSVQMLQCALSIMSTFSCAMAGRSKKCFFYTRSAYNRILNQSNVFSWKIFDPLTVECCVSNADAYKYHNHSCLQLFMLTQPLQFICIIFIWCTLLCHDVVSCSFINSKFKKTIQWFAVAVSILHLQIIDNKLE